ncbi:MAG: hypothetical protein JSS29_04275 [Proteobacteria bacterium]|nr:hypothetical protein [Pseudomonadota bacterium]
MTELVIVLTDLYLAEPAAAPAPLRLPGLERVARLGTRTVLPTSWRAWLAARLDVPAAAEAAPAVIAGAALPSAPAGAWIATPVRLTASLSQVHLDPRGLLRLDPGAQARLVESFARTFSGSGCTLHALPCGEFLLGAPALPVVPREDPERCLGAEVGAALPQGAEASGLRRLASEIEMWLHGLAPGGAAGAPNALWLWGASGAPARPAPGATLAQWQAYGADAFVDGLWHLHGQRAGALPRDFGALGGAVGGSAVLMLRVAQELQASMSGHFLEALAALDARFIEPAVAALGRGALRSLTVLANDRCLQLHPGASWRFWRRGRTGSEALR